MARALAGAMPLPPPGLLGGAIDSGTIPCSEHPEFDMDLSHSDGDPAFTGLVRAFYTSLPLSPPASDTDGAVRAPAPNAAGPRQSPST